MKDDPSTTRAEHPLRSGQGEDDDRHMWLGVLYGGFLRSDVGVAVKMVKIWGGYVPLKNIFFGGRIPPVNVHSFTGEGGGGKTHRQNGLRGCENGRFWRKVKQSEGLFVKVYIFCFLFMGLVKYLWGW